MPLMPKHSRIAGHVRLLGILWIAISVFRLLPGMALVVIFKHGFPFPPAAPPFLPALLHLMGSLMLLGGILGIVVGVGLLHRQSWARMGALLLGGVNLIDMPFGTAIGIYTLWVLLPAKSEKEYQQFAEGGLAAENG